MGGRSAAAPRALVLAGNTTYGKHPHTLRTDCKQEATHEASAGKKPKMLLTLCLLCLPQSAVPSTATNGVRTGRGWLRAWLQHVEFLAIAALFFLHWLKS